MTKYRFDGDPAADVLDSGVAALDAVTTLILAGEHSIQTVTSEGLGAMLKLIYERLEEGRDRSRKEGDELRTIRKQEEEEKFRALNPGFRRVTPIDLEQ